MTDRESYIISLPQAAEVAPRDTSESVGQCGRSMTCHLIANAVSVTSGDLTSEELAAMAEHLNALWLASAEVVAAAYGVTIAVGSEQFGEGETRARVGLARRLRVA
jgi:hypothetical protein